MYQLKALIWKAYKVRLRSPLASVLDICGPLLIIILYICLKATLSSFVGLNQAPGAAAGGSGFTFRGSNSKALDPSAELPLRACPKILFVGESSSSSSNGSLRQSITSQCGVQLIDVANRDTLVSKLRSSLEQRIAFRPGDRSDLTKNSSKSTGGCFTLPGASEPSYQVGLVIRGQESIEIHMTDVAGNPVIYQPYSQGSYFDELAFPHSDFNSGLHFLEICLGNAYRQMISSRARDYRQDKQENNTTTNGTNTGSNTLGQNLKWHITPTPVTAASHAIPGLFMIFQLAANLCNVLATVLRITEDNETGLHHYLRTAGVPAGIYWTSQMLVLIIHMAIQSLVIAILLAIPTGTTLFDPISETGITLRWLLLFTYSLAVNAHAMFVASLFDRTSHSLLVTCLLATCYCMFPNTFLVQWSPFDYAPLGGLQNYILSNPVSNYQALLLVIYSVQMQTNQPLNMGQFGMKILGGGISDWTLGALWQLLVFQIFAWFLATTIFDQLYYSSSYKPWHLPESLANELCCCNRLGPSKPPDSQSGISSKSTKSTKSTKSAKQGQTVKDPNRVCCSLKNLSVRGPTTMMAYTQGNPLKTTKFFQKSPKSPKTPKTPTKSPLPRSNLRPGSSASYFRDDPIILDEAMAQHVFWRKTAPSFENLNLDFRFNQVSFILGPTQSKELFFSALLGLRNLDSGLIIVDGIKFTPATINLARPHIGYLGERDIFLNEMSIFENLQFFGSLRDSSYTQYDSESLFLLGLLHLSSRRDNLPMALTSRSARKLALAVAAVGHTKLLLLVEPTLGLRWKPRCQVLNLLKKYKRIRSIVVDTSDVDEAVAFGDRIVLLNNGEACLDGTPERLTRSLACGHWIIFEPSVVSKASAHDVSSGNLHALDKLAEDTFKGDKIGHLEVSRRSIFEEESMSHMGKDISKSSKAFSSKQTDASHRPIVILKIHHSQNSYQGIGSFLKLFAQHNNNLHGFRLAELTYESLEDVMVIYTSKARYPDLPPDLLISLHHRTLHSGQVTDDQFKLTKFSNDSQVPLKLGKPIFSAQIKDVLRDRVSKGSEILLITLALLISLFWVGLMLWCLQNSLRLEQVGGDKTDQSLRIGDQGTVDLSLVDQLYKYRQGLYIIEREKSTRNSISHARNKSDSLLKLWPGNPKLTGSVAYDLNETDANYVNSIILRSRDLISSIVFLNPQTGQTTVVFEPHLPNALNSALRTFISYQLMLSKSTSRSDYSNYNNKVNSTNHPYAKIIITNNSENDSLTTTRDDNSISFGKSSSSRDYKTLSNTSTTTFRATSKHIFHQAWHETVGGHLIRGFFYGVGFAFAEGIAIGVLVIAPIRHRTESRVVKVRQSYWFAMALFDLTFSMLLVIGYVILIILFEKTYSISLLICIVIVLILYKLASLPIAYLVSLVVESVINGLLFIILMYITIGWVFTIHLKTFFDWTVYSVGYLYTISTWLLLLFPISSLIDSLADINHINRVDYLCAQVPAYTATTNIDGIQKPNKLDRLMKKVHECLVNGKDGISTDVLHQQEFGILWNIYLITLFGIVAWMFLLFSERVFGIIARRFNSNRATNEQLKTMIRSNEPTASLFKWDREKDRLVSEYVRCLNEASYVKQMTNNCLFMRIWLKPMGDQSSIDKRMSNILEPIVSLGQPKNEIQVELKTTLHLFIRIGTESSRYKISKIQLMETYSRFVKEHGDFVTKFAVIDWTKETLYKILLHGHYNTKSTLVVT